MCEICDYLKATMRMNFFYIEIVLIYFMKREKKWWW